MFKANFITSLCSGSIDLHSNWEHLYKWTFTSDTNENKNLESGYEFKSAYEAIKNFCEKGGRVLEDVFEYWAEPDRNYGGGDLYGDFYTLESLLNSCNNIAESALEYGQGVSPKLIEFKVYKYPLDYSGEENEEFYIGKFVYQGLVFKEKET